MTDQIKTSSEPETYSREHVKALREEMAQLRQEAVWARERAEASATEARRHANDRVIRAELRAAATHAGMIDLDGLKLADFSRVSLNGAGEVQGAKELMADLRQTKPYLFSSGTPTNAGSASAAPSVSRPRHASEMSKEEFERELKKLTRR